MSATKDEVSGMRAAEAPVSASTIPLLMGAISDPNTSLKLVAEVVARDAGLTARVLAVANSAAFGMPRQVTEISQAVGLVGSNLCQTMAVAGACHLLDGRTGLPNVKAHALGVACGARLLAGRNGLSTPDAFAAGLLHDLGEILLWQRDREAYAEAAATWESTFDQLRFERSSFGIDHMSVARQQLAEWKLPGSVVDAVGDHHRPDLQHVDISTCVVAAEQLLDPDDPCTHRRFEVLGVADHVEVVRAEVADLARDAVNLFGTS